MKRVITLFAVLLMGWSVNALSFACKTANGTAIPIGGGSANVYVNLAPAVNVGQNLVVDLSTQIFCHNDYPETITDYVTLQRGSAYGGVLSNFSGTVKYSGSSYPFPTTSETPRVVYNSRTDKPWPVALYLTPVSSAGGVAIKAGSLIAVLILRQTTTITAMISSLCGIFTPIMMWWCLLAAAMFLLVMSPLLCRTTLFSANSSYRLLCEKPKPGVLPLRHNRRCGQLDFHQYRVVFTCTGRRRTVDAQRYDYSSE